MPRNRNSSDPTKRPSRRGPVSLAISEFRNLLIVKGVMQPEQWDEEIEKLVADQYKRFVDYGAKMGSETSRVRQLEDTLDERERRIAQLEREVTELHKELREYKKGPKRDGR